MFRKKPSSFEKSMLKVLITTEEILISKFKEIYDENFTVNYMLEKTGFFQTSLTHDMPQTVDLKRQTARLD